MAIAFELQELFAPFFQELEGVDNFPHETPLLSHYTSIAAFEKIIASKEVWFSSPLRMNDIRESQAALDALSNQFIAMVSALGEDVFARARKKILLDTFLNLKLAYERQRASRLFVFCLSEHNPDDNDGLLSMWRGYGGDGSGVAIVFDSSKLRVADRPLLIVSKVVISLTKNVTSRPDC